MTLLYLVAKEDIDDFNTFTSISPRHLYQISFNFFELLLISKGAIILQNQKFQIRKLNT